MTSIQRLKHHSTTKNTTAQTIKPILEPATDEQMSDIAMKLAFVISSVQSLEAISVKKLISFLLVSQPLTANGRYTTLIANAKYSTLLNKPEKDLLTAPQQILIMITATKPKIRKASVML